MGRATALDIVASVAEGLGLVKPSDIFTTTDNNVIQLRTLFNNAGQELEKAFNWQYLQKEYTFQTVASQAEYDLPSDYSRMVSDSQWDRTDRWPMIGPKNSVEWQALKGSNFVSGPRYRWRIWGDKIHIYPTPGADVATIAFEYMSNGWLKKVDNSYVDKASANDDLCLHDSLLMNSFLKFQFLDTKGLDATSARDEYLRIYNLITGHDGAASILCMDRSRRGQLLSTGNVPEGSW